MKKYILCLCIFMATCIYASEIENPQKFEVTFTITYNSVSLQEAAERERIIKENFKGACKIDVAVKKIGKITGDYILPDDEQSTIYIDPQYFDYHQIYYSTRTITDRGGK